jgi:hypothetical protein
VACKRVADEKLLHRPPETDGKEKAAATERIITKISTLTFIFQLQEVQACADFQSLS